MAQLPLPAEQIFKDFAFDLISCAVKRNGAVLEGLLNNDEEGRYIAFLHGCDILIGDVIVSENKRYLIEDVQTYSYNGAPSMVRAYY